MPGFYLGCDWISVQGTPPQLGLLTALKRGGVSMPNFEDYKIVIVQQVAGRAWMNLIYRLREKGIAVLYEIDDYLHGVHKVPGHAAQHVFTKKRMPDYEMCMKASTGMIVSTDWLADTYRQFNPNIFVCQNSIEGKRYAQYEIPSRISGTINIGWAGGFGHQQAVASWLPAVRRILDERDDVRFISVGLTVADLLDRPRQAIALPPVLAENFPGVLTNFDVAIAPAGRSKWYAAKSDLRFVETGALGIPLVSDPFVYGSVKDGETGLLAETSEEAYEALIALVNSAELRQRIGGAAKEYVHAERIIEVGVEQWERVFTTVPLGRITE